MGKNGRLVWITGLSGSGKTTLARRLCDYMGNGIVYMDGDDLRKILSETTTHDMDGRKRTAKIYSRLCSYLTRQGADVVMSTISLFHDIHKNNRRNNSRYCEVFLDVDENILKDRRKNLYFGEMDNVIGIGQEPEFPRSPTLTLSNNYACDINKNVQKIIEVLDGL
ncbi:MAG: adenylyl-sulfate kinase [Nanoarchaeota archaeon]|nr:adenylyl-sulfate kinase [Nanoarchaeota archaeon]